MLFRASLDSEPHNDALPAVYLDHGLDCGGRALATTNYNSILVQGRSPAKLPGQTQIVASPGSATCS